MEIMGNLFAEKQNAASGRVSRMWERKLAARQCATAGRASRIELNVTVVRGVITRRAFPILEALIDAGSRWLDSRGFSASVEPASRGRATGRFKAAASPRPTTAA
jgi:hypothetical protein